MGRAARHDSHVGTDGGMAASLPAPQKIGKDSLPVDIKDGVIAQVDAFVSDTPQFDDITVVVVVCGSAPGD